MTSWKCTLMGACLTLALLSVGAEQAAAQVSRVDSAAVLLAAADHFEAAGQREAAEAIYRHLVERFAGTTAAGVAQTRITRVFETGVEGAGRIELQVWSTTYGLFMGVMVPMALGAEDAEPYGLGLLLGGPTGFFGGRAIARARPLTEGQARAITWGGTWGTWQGFGWAMALDLGQEQVCNQGYCYQTDSDGAVIARAVIAGGALGIVTGNLLSRRTISPGTATAVNLGSLWGTWFGFAAGMLADMEDDALLSATLIGGDAGLLTTALMAPKWNVTRSRARLVSLAGVVGGVAGLGLDLLLQPDDEKVWVGIPLATSVLGLAVGIGSTRDAALAPATPGDGDAPAEPGLALLNLSDGAWSLGAPLPTPVLREVEGPRGYRRGVGLSLPLFRGSF